MSAVNHQMIFDQGVLSASWFGEERPRNMLLLTGSLVASLHVGLFVWLNNPAELISQAKPLVMEVAMVSMAAPKPAPLPPAPVVEQKPQPPKKVQQKPVSKPLPKVVQESPDFAPTSLEPPPLSAETQQQSSASTSASAKSAEAASFTEANFRANYDRNPKPEYPRIARSRGWQGKVLLRVEVSVDGLSAAVKIEQSSGYDILDESALDAVKEWRFIPAKRGDTPVSSSVIVPIVFSLRT